MDITVDARGLLCPEPVLLTKRAFGNVVGGTFRVLVDNNAARENVTRLAVNSGWKVSVSGVGNDYILTLTK